VLFLRCFFCGAFFAVSFAVEWDIIFQTITNATLIILITYFNYLL